MRAGGVELVQSRPVGRNESAGFLGRVVYSDGKLVMRRVSDEQEAAALIKRAYGAEIVKSQAKKYGWLIKQTGQFEYQVTKR